jgi:hypothetical protein
MSNCSDFFFDIVTNFSNWLRIVMSDCLIYFGICGGMSVRLAIDWLCELYKMSIPLISLHLLHVPDSFGLNGWRWVPIWDDTELLKILRVLFVSLGSWSCSLHGWWWWLVVLWYLSIMVPQCLCERSPRVLCAYRSSGLRYCHKQTHFVTLMHTTFFLLYCLVFACGTILCRFASSFDRPKLQFWQLNGITRMVPLCAPLTHVRMEL